MKNVILIFAVNFAILAALWMSNIIIYNDGYSECRIFSPTQDITAYELAFIYEKTGNKGFRGVHKIYFTPHDWQNLSSDVQRHFFECLK